MSFTLSAVDNLFPIPLFRYRVDEAGLNERLAKEIAARRKAESGMTSTNRVGWQSEHDFFLRKEPGHASLARLLGVRSEEHTSALQSLMRISYAVFSLKK